MYPWGDHLSSVAQQAMTTCRSCLVADFLLHHLARVLFKRASFFSGRHSSLETESILIPRKVRVVKGPSKLAGSTGSPSLVAVQIVRSRVLWQVAWSADEKMKSSRLCVRSIMLDHIMAHARPSAMALKIIGADLRPMKSPVAECVVPPGDP